MKLSKIISIILLAVMCVVMSACSGNSGESSDIDDILNEKHTMIAIVKGNDDRGLVVEEINESASDAEPGSDSDSNDLFVIPKEMKISKKFDKFEVGDRVEIVYSGMFFTTIPAIFSNVHSIKNAD